MPHFGTDLARRSAALSFEPDSGAGACEMGVSHAQEMIPHGPRECGIAPAGTQSGRDRAHDRPHDVAPLVLTRRVGRSVWVERACPLAMACGIRPGITLGQAQALAPNLASRECDDRRDAAALEKLADWALRFSPMVQSYGENSLLVDVSGAARLFGDERNIARQALGGLARQGFQAQAAIADTVGAAYALATAGAEVLCIVPPGQGSAALAGLPPDALRLEADAARRLEQLGVRSIGDLLMLPRSSLPSRFGAGLVLRLQQALGEAHEGVTTRLPYESPRAEVRFDGATEDRATIEHAATGLLDELLAGVLRAGLSLRRMDCVLVHERESPTVLSIRLARASRQRTHLLELLRARLEALALHIGVCGLSLTAMETSRWSPGQGDLFEPRDPGQQETLGSLVDRLANRLGHESLLIARLEDDHQPEFAYRLRPFIEAGDADDGGGDSVNDGVDNGAVKCAPNRAPTVREGSARASEAASDLAAVSTIRADLAAVSAIRAHVGASAGPLPDGRGSDGLVVRSPEPSRDLCAARPLLLFPRPLPIRVIALVPDGPPTWLAHAGRGYAIVRAWGPERIETAWWRGPDVRRDYFRVLSETGEQFWIFVDPATRQWRMHGVFA
ncbi:MAG: DNA polymerase Y family protein [Phycisphaerae bacterium]